MFECREARKLGPKGRAALFVEKVRPKKKTLRKVDKGLKVAQ